MERLGEVMDCDCELLHNEPPSIPLYLFHSSFFPHITCYPPALLSHTELCMHTLIDAATCIERGCEDVYVSAHTETNTRAYCVAAGTHGGQQGSVVVQCCGGRCPLLFAPACSQPVSHNCLTHRAALQRESP